MLTITGGKLTTWRRMAKQVVDRMVEREGRDAPCRTDDIPLGMAAREGDLDRRRAWPRVTCPAGYRGPARLPLRARRPQRARLAGERPELAAADRRWPARPARRGRRSPPGSSRRARSPTCSCGAPGSGCSRPRSCERASRSRRSPRRWRELGWDDARAAGRERSAGSRTRPPRGSTRPREESRSVSLRGRWPATRTSSISPTCTSARPTPGSPATACCAATSWSRRSRRDRREATPESEPVEPDEADTDESVIEATVLDDKEETPVEPDRRAPRAATSAATSPDRRRCAGVLELTPQGYGFLRLDGLTPSDDDVYVSASQIRRCELRPGDEVAGPAREPRRGERHRALVHVDRVNGDEPQRGAPRVRRPCPGAARAADPARQRPDDVLAAGGRPARPARLRPAGPGPRGRRARAARRCCARSRRAAAAVDDRALIVLLIDERPEEATAWREALPDAEFAIATAELAPGEQVRTAELALERARRLAEAGVDAVLVCDSLSRLALRRRRHGRGQAAVRLRARTRRRRVADRGRDRRLRRRGDEGEAERAVITTESSLVTLDPELAAAGIVPALVASECRVSNEEQLREADELEAVRKLRRLLTDLDRREAADALARADRGVVLERRAARLALASGGRRGRPRRARARARSARRRDPAARSRRCASRRRRRRRARPP